MVEQIINLENINMENINIENIKKSEYIEHYLSIIKIKLKGMPIKQIDEKVIQILNILK